MFPTNIKDRKERKGVFRTNNKYKKGRKGVCKGVANKRIALFVRFFC